MAGKTDITALTALELRDRLAEGQLRAVEVAEAFLQAVRDRDEAVQAWAFLDEAHVMMQAKALDRYRSTGRPLGPLHGVPVALKDIIDTADMPTENGTTLDAGRKPRQDAFVVGCLRQAGALVMGKTATTELAVLHPTKTRNPHDPERTPGGSSSGSVAAVASGMAPLALGTQTNGSVIRPASFCGIVGFKPSRGTISRRGVLVQSPHLDTLGVFGRTVADAALAADIISMYDDDDASMSPQPRPRLLEGARAEPPLPPVFAFVRSPVWDRTDEATREGFAELCEELGDQVDEVELPEVFDRAHDLHRTVMLTEIARNYARYYDGGREQLSEKLRGMIEEGRTIKAVDYALAVDWIEVLGAGLDRFFDRYDAILTPAAPGEAPEGLSSTGDPAFCTIWTYCGVPAITLPLLQGPNGLPVGVQLIGRRGYDARLMRTAAWLMRRFGVEGR